MPIEYEEKCGLGVAGRAQVTELKSHGVGVYVFIEVGMRPPGAFLCVIFMCFYRA